MNVCVSSLLSSTASSTITATASSNVGQPQQPQPSHKQPSVTSVASSSAKSQPTMMTAASPTTSSPSTSTSAGEQPQRLVIEDSSLNNTPTKEKPSLSKTNCDEEGTNKEEKKAGTQPLTSSIKQPLALTRTPRPACLFPQAKE